MKKLVFAIAIAAAMLFSSGAHADADPASNALVRCADLVTAVGEGEFMWASGAQTCANANQIISTATFESWILNTGSCAGSSTLMMTFGQMRACAVLGTLQSAVVSYAGVFASSSLDPHGIPSCSTTGAVTSYVLPSNTIAPTSSATALAWYPNGHQNQTYTVGFYTPTGSLAYQLEVPTTSSTAPIVYYASGQPAGAWTIVASGLGNMSCSGTNAIGTQGLATGTAEWYAP